MYSEIHVEISRLYVSFFNRAADPEGMEYWVDRYNEAVAEGRDGKDFLEDIADSFAQSPEAKAIYETVANPTDAQIAAYIATAYENMFGRTPDAEGLAYWTGRWKAEMAEGRPGVRVLFEIENAARNSTNADDVAALQNKAEVAAKFTTDFIASGATWTQADFALAASIVKGVNHTPESVQEANDLIQEIIDGRVEDPDGGQVPNPGGGGGGGGTPRPDAVNIDGDGKIIITDGVPVTLNETSDSFVFSRDGHRTVTVEKSLISEIAISSEAQVNVAPETSLDVFSGNGTVNVTGVTFEPAAKVGAPNSLDSVPDIKPMILQAHNNGLKVSVNGNEADTIKALWDYWDEGYVRDFPNSYTSLEINSATIELGIRYLEYLGYPDKLDEGGPAFTDIIAKGGNGREQTLHDNLLGNLTYASVTDRRFEDEVEESFLDRIPLDIQNRPWVSGYAGDVGNTAHDVARAFDYAQGWDRDDWIDYVLSGTVDEAGINPVNDYLYFGRSNTTDNFNIVRHEGAGLEIALKAKVRGGGGEDYEALEYDEDGVAIFNVEPGAGSANGWTPAKWSFDYSIVSGLNGSDLELGDLVFVLSIDVDPGEDNSPITFTLTYDDGKLVWISDNDLRLGGDEISPENVEQNSFNIGFNHIIPLVNEIVGGDYLFDEGKFDIKISAYLDEVELVANSIQVNVGLIA